jgi:hypothetical protein
MGWSAMHINLCPSSPINCENGGCQFPADAAPRAKRLFAQIFCFSGQSPAVLRLQKLKMPSDFGGAASIIAEAHCGLCSFYSGTWHWIMFDYDGDTCSAIL